MTDTQTIQLLTVEEVAEILKLDPRTVYRKCEANDIPHFRVGETGAVRFVKAKVLEWIEAQHRS